MMAKSRFTQGEAMHIVAIGSEFENLHGSAFIGDLAALQRLVLHEGTDINCKVSGQTPLHLAASAGRDTVVRFLLATCHATPTAENNRGSTPIHTAARNGHATIVELLLSYGVQTDIRGAHGQTALMLAARKDYVNVVRVLLTGGADPCLEDDTGRSAADTAVSLHCTHLLRRHILRNTLKPEHGGRYQVDSQDPIDRGASCTSVFAIDIVSGERVALLSFDEQLPYERVKYAYRALQRKYAGGFGLMQPIPTPTGVTTALRKIVLEAWGPTLEDHRNAQGGQISQREAKCILWCLLRCVRDLHAEKLVHTRVVPQSLVRYWDGKWRLVDLHYARLQGEAVDESNIVHRGNFSGTGTVPAVMPCNPPELNQRATHGADIWAVGVLATTLLLGSDTLTASHLAGPRKSYEAAVAKWIGGRLQDDRLDFCLRLLEYDPAHRCTAQEALDHGFFSSYLKSRDVVPNEIPITSLSSANGLAQSERQPERLRVEKWSDEGVGYHIVQEGADEVDQAWHEQIDCVHGLLNGRRGKARLTKLRKYAIHERPDEFDLLKSEGFSQTYAEDLDVFADDIDANDAGTYSDESDSASSEDPGEDDGLFQKDSLAVAGGGRNELKAERKSSTLKNRTPTAEPPYMLLPGKVKIAYNKEALHEAMMRRHELEARQRYAKTARMTMVEFNAWLSRRKVVSLMQLEESRREQLLDVLRSSIDRRWQNAPNFYNNDQENSSRTQHCLNKLLEISDTLEISTPRLFCVLPSRNATSIDDYRPKWLDSKRWNPLSFSLHPMCEWGCGHFLDSRHSYSLTNPLRNLRDMAGVLEYSLEILQDCLREMEHSNAGSDASFVVPLSPLRTEYEMVAKGEITDVLLPAMKRVLKIARSKALKGAKSAAEAAVAAQSVGTSLCNLENFVLNADPLQSFGGLHRCTPPAGDSSGRRTTWLCQEHADFAVHEGGWSLELGRTPQWTTGGLLHVLSDQPLGAPSFPFVPPKVTDIPQVTSDPPSATDLNKLYEPKTDTLLARHVLRRLADPKAASCERAVDVEAIVASAPGVDSAVALVREDIPGRPIIVAYASPLGADRETIISMCTIRLVKGRKPAAVVLMPGIPDIADTIDPGLFPKPGPRDWLVAAQSQELGDALSILRVLGDPSRAKAHSLSSSTCCIG
jgi:hypothetical protein